MLDKIKCTFLVSTIIFISGCGYTTSSLLPAHLKTIYIQPFRNKIELTDELPLDQYRFRSYTPNLETDVTKKVIDKFINDGNLKVAKEEDASLILTGELIDFLKEPVRYGDDNETVEEYRMSIVCSVEVKDVKNDTFLWRNPRVIGDSTYSVSGSTTESSAISNAISDLARRIVNHTVEGW